MPRVNAKGKWNLKMSPDEWYWNEDPWKVKNNKEEKKKTMFISTLIEDRKGYGCDIGCGEGHSTVEYWIRKENMVDVDCSTMAIARATDKHRPLEKLSFRPLDISKYYIMHEFSTIILSEVLYYIRPDKWKHVADNIYKMLYENGQLIVSVGQYFTEADIRKIFKKIDFDKVYKLPSKKYEYNLIMSGHYVG